MTARSYLLAFVVGSAASFGGMARAQAPAATPPTAAAPAVAPAGPKPKWVEVCDADMKSLCKEQMKGDVRPCLYEKLDQLSEGCGKAMRSYKVAELCREDIGKLCKEEAAAGQLGKCLKDKKEELSKPCKEALLKGSKQAKVEQKAEAVAAKAEEPPKVEAKPADKKSSKKAKH